jgi:hypothetical protein
MTMRVSVMPCHRFVILYLISVRRFEKLKWWVCRNIPGGNCYTIVITLCVCLCVRKPIACVTLINVDILLRNLIWWCLRIFTALRGDTVKISQRWRIKTITDGAAKIRHSLKYRRAHLFWVAFATRKITTLTLYFVLGSRIFHRISLCTQQLAVAY